MRKMFLFFIVSVCCSVFSVDYVELSRYYKVSAEELSSLIETCKKFVAKNNMQKEMQAYNKNLENKIQQKIEDNNSLTLPGAFQQYSLDWLADNSKKLENEDMETIKKAVFMFIYFMENEILLPGQLRERFNSDNLNKLINLLNEKFH